MPSVLSMFAVLFAALALAGCGNGPGSGASSYNSSGQVASTSASQVNYYAAARFAEQVSFGPTPALIAEIQSKGYSKWIDEQMAAKDIEGALDLGWTRGKVIYTVFGNLAGKPISDATWGKTAQFFRNEIAVAKHYTEVLNQSTTDLQTLRDVLSAVGYSDDVTTEAAIEALISQGLLVGAVSQADSGGNGV